MLFRSLDLNGFQISRVSPDGNGIEISGTSSRTTVRNGTIKGFLSGILGNAKACAFRDLAVTGCTSYGIFAGEAAVLESCRAHDNAGTAAIFAGIGSSLTNCIASNNASGPNCVGIRTGVACTITHCTASANSGIGIRGGEGSIIKDCVAYSNSGDGITGGNGCTITSSSSQYNLSTGITTLDHSTVSNCNLSNNTIAGLYIFNESIIADCTISRNKGDGIRCNSNNTIEHNAVNANGMTGAGDGISPVGYGNRIDSNNVRYNEAAGIHLSQNNAHNVVIRNTLGANTGGNYLVGTGNGVGPIISITAGNLGNAANSPFANIQD